MQDLKNTGLWVVLVKREGALIPKWSKGCANDTIQEGSRKLGL